MPFAYMTLTAQKASGMPADISEAFRFMRNGSKVMAGQGRSADLSVTVDDVLVAAKFL